MMIWMVAAALSTALQTGLNRPEDVHFTAAQGALDEQLLDYPAARFRDVRGEGPVICGFVNAKNRMGAYTGWARFVWFKMGAEPARLMIDDGKDGSRADIFLDGFCGDDGHRIESPDYSDRLTHR